MFKRLLNRLLDYVAYVILGVLGLGIFNILYVTWFTETGRVVLSLCMMVGSIIWASARLFRKRS